MPRSVTADRDRVGTTLAAAWGALHIAAACALGLTVHDAYSHTSSAPAAGSPDTPADQAATNDPSTTPTEGAIA
ncbi:hypothetical protein ABT095_19915 [Kitasatospora sp. NPDC002227]|uniref:hypothetical protein n=1 Tax=Kitasatospora sp. NPDC002227 TaxID=3154773 RepID=UPI00332C628C